MIREATAYDIDGIVALFSVFSPDVDAAHWREEAMAHMNNGASFTLVAEHGGELIGFFVGRIAYEPNIDGKICIEHHWFANPSKRSCGNELRRSAEKLAKARGATKMLLHCSNDGVEKIVSKAGYKREYTIYGRSI